MADENTCSFLKKHGLERLVTVFSENKIIRKDFKYLRENLPELQQLLPTLRDRIDFTEALTELQRDEYTQADFEPPIVPREGLRKICERHESGRKFLDLYKIVNGKRIYPPDGRQLIKNALIEHFFVLNKGHLTHWHFKEMVQIIVDELPDEDPRIWYVKGDGDKSAGGLLYNRYRYVQSTDQRFKQPKKTQAEPGPSQPIGYPEWNKLTAEGKTMCEAAKSKLKVTGFTDHVTIISCWKESYPLRRHEAITGTIIFKDWDLLANYENIYELVNYDFKQVHSSSNDTFTQNVPIFIQIFRKVFEAYRFLIQEDGELCEAIVTNFKDEVHVNDVTMFLSFYSLPLILRQSFAAKDKKRVRVAIFNCRSAYITLVATDAKVKEVVMRRRREALESKQTVQPYIIVVGTTEQQSYCEFYVILDELTFKCKTMLAAIDLHFKLHTVFHLKYAKECEAVMQFIQSHMYEIEYPSERLDSLAVALSTDCKRL